MKKDIKQFKVGQRVKIIKGAPVSPDDVYDANNGKTGVVIDINNHGWSDPKHGEYGYKVSPDDGVSAVLWYPFSSLKKVKGDEQ